MPRPTRPTPEAGAPLLIPNRHARRIFLDRQGLAAAPVGKQSKTDLLRLIEKLGFVQIDSIQTVERAHHMTLFARNQTYRRADLEALLHDDRALFENWTHDAAIIPTAFFPHWQRRFVRDEEKLRARWQKWRSEPFEQVLDEVLAKVARDGPVMARTLSPRDRKSAGGWWNWHPSKTALEFHWRTGNLAVTRREAFQKVYDLTERVIPQASREPTPTCEALIDWCCASALERLGFATAGELAAFWDIITAAEAKAWCTSGNGRRIRRVLIEPADGSAPHEALACPTTLAHTEEPKAPPSRIRVLSPFDPVVRDRRRLRRLFGFNYRIEVFVPEPQRTYGYYVFPLLEGDRFVGRIDIKRNVRDAALHINNLWWEPGFRPTAQRSAKLDAELARLGRFVACPTIIFDCPR